MGRTTLIFGAIEPSGGGEALRVFGAVVIVAAISLLVTHRRLRRAQRIRPVAALVSSGWLAIGVGVLLGPHVLDMIEPGTLLEVRPLLLIGLGWIGAIVGMQAHRGVLAHTPKALWRWSGTDICVSVGIAAIALVLLVPRMPPEQLTFAWLLLPGAFLCAATIGWAPETRSLQDRLDEPSAHLAIFVRGGSGLGALGAVTLFGVAAAFAVRTAEGEFRIDLAAGLLAILVAMVLAWLAAVGGRYLLVVAGADKSESLVVFLGVVSLVAGVAAELQHSPLFASMLAGVMISNLSGASLRAFEWFLLRAEQVVANVFFLLAGVLLEPRIGGSGWGIVALLVAARLLVKPLVMRRLVVPARHDLPERSSLYGAPVRQSPLAIALGVGLVLAEPSALSVRLLTVIALVGLRTELLPTAMSIAVRRRIHSRAAESAASAESSPSRSGRRSSSASSHGSGGV